jgi:hypothetical protein
MPIDYSQTKIYKIEPTCPHEEGEVYYGSTTKKYLSQRFATHFCNYRNNRNKTTARVLFEKYGVENCAIELVESYPCKTSDERKQREGHYIRTIPCVNRQIPDRTRQEYEETHIEERRERCRQWRETHAEENREYHRQYRETHAEQVRECHRQYREAHAEERREYARQWRLRKKAEKTAHSTNEIPVN